MRTYDVLGIGFGPANLALAIALQETASDLDIRFVEARPGPAWQSTMMLAGSDIQNHPVRDLVSLRNPRSRYSFINYLFEHDRLLAHLNLPREFPLRKEYEQYIRWAANDFADLVDYQSYVTEIGTGRNDDDAPCYTVHTATGKHYQARALVIGTGRTPYLPTPFATIKSPRIFHLTDYLPALDRLTEQGIITEDRGAPLDIAIVGGSQSAVELTLDLAQRFPAARVTTYVRPYSLRQKDTSPFSEEGYFPDFTDYYYRAPRHRKDALDSYLRLTNYSAADGDVLRELYCLIYEQRLDGNQRVFVRGSRQIRQAHADDTGVALQIEELNTGEREHVRADMVILATGFRDLGPGAHQERVPPLLDALADRFAFDDHGYLKVALDYEVQARVADTPIVFLNGLCESSHGIGDSGSFSLLSIRAEAICSGLRKRLC
ncbi:MAG: SidA/IucD/PvdA family monooxygenase [Mycobacteriaceae bacterium]|nr:SidA/IucD/PvdA family monooxygenase [Mycobacteriaceae bacterium]